MPTVPTPALETLIRAIYEAKGVPPDEAAIVAAHQVGANLVGHDSHGAIRTPTYVDRLDRGHIVPGAPLTVERESATTAVLDGNWGWGFVQTERAVRIAVGKARDHGVAAVTIRHQSHMGRLGHYMERVAAEGMIGLLTADSGRGPKAVAPFGGRQARLGTNPLSFGVPTGAAPLVLDMATSAVAGGKIQLLRNQGRTLPPGWLLDAQGRPTTDPEEYFAGGALLPLGGTEAHKGSGLSVIVEILCGLLTGLGFGVAADSRHNDGNFLAVFDVARFRDLSEFQDDVRAFASYLKATPPADGFDEVLYPGELEARTAVTRRAEGVPVDERTWEQLLGLADELGIAHPEAAAPQHRPE